MYINQIIEIMIETLDRIYEYWIEEKEKNKEIIQFEKIIKEKNFKKYQKDINKLFEFLFIFIPEDQINKIVTKNNNIELIKNIIRKYISYYIFLLIGMSYEGKIEDFNNNIIEYTKEQYNYNVKIDDFYTTESNSNIIKNLKLINEILNLISNPKKEKSEILKNFIETIDIETFIEDIKSKKSKYDKYNNIIKNIIILNLFDKESKNIFNIIENSELLSGEFIFIDVVYNKIDYIELLSIENILEANEVYKGIAETIYEMINEDELLEIENIKKYNIDYDYKIKKLFDYKFLIPIVDDFLLYHKDYEKYEKIKDNVKQYNKRDDTKIKYIINKLNNVKDYYKNKNEISKIFHKPMIDKKVILVNNYEDLKIILTSENIIKSNSQNMDLIVDFYEYHEYPFIPFKDYEKTYFLYSNDKTIDVIRNVNFVNDVEHNFKNLQIRIASENMFINVIGFAITINKNNLSCFKTDNFKIIENKNINKNIEKIIDDKIEFSVFKNNNIEKKLYYLLFDLDNQKFETPSNYLKSTNSNDKIKIILSYLYDKIIKNIILKIKNNISKMSEKNIIKNENILNKFIRKFPDIENKDYSEIYNNLLYFIYYEHNLIIKDFYDKNEDIFKGLYGNILKIPEYTPIIHKKVLKLNINTGLQKNKFIINKNSEEVINATCQHYISWRKIDKKDTNKVYEFVQQYAIRNQKDQFICKSCSTKLDIQKYITNVVFNKKTHKFEDYDVSVSGTLEDLIEYSKYNNGIKYIDNRIDRIANIINIFSLKGNDFLAKAKRKIMVKSTIDLLINQQKFIDKSNYLLNRVNFLSKYNIKKELNDFFKFNLENSIFIKSSKEKVDYNKIQKLNNVICYILILFIIDITEPHILSLNNTDMICNLKNFKINKKNIFGNKMIIINLSHDVKSILDFPILCYLIYIFSCFIIKYNIWENKTVDKNDFAKNQQTVINTLIEILNAILIVNKDDMHKNNIFLYDIFFTRYYLKLPMFEDKDENIMKKIEWKYMDKKEEVKKLSFDTHEYDMNKNIYDSKSNIVDDIYNRFGKKSELLILNIEKNKKKDVEKVYNVSNLTNCDYGLFHYFVNDGKKLICNFCKAVANVYENGIDKQKEIMDKCDIIYLKKLEKKYCIDGKIHKFINDVCKYCNYKKGEDIKHNDKFILKMYKNIQDNINKNNIIIENILKNNNIKNEDEQKNIKKILDKILYKFKKYENNLNNSIDSLIDKIQELLGIDIYIDNKFYNLKKDIYIMEYDIDGTKLSTPEKITDDDNQIKYITNHPIFKKDVIIVFLERNSKFEVAFGAKSKMILGYRKIGKDFQLVNNACNIKINYSITNIFLYFGFIRYTTYLNDFYLNDKITMNEFVNKCGKYRYNAVKSLGYIINKYINRLKNKYNVVLIYSKFPSFVDEGNKLSYDNYNNDKLDIIYETFFKKFNNDLNIANTENNISHTFMKYINTINDYLYYEHINIDLKENEFINSDDIIKNDFSSNIIMNYIIDEIIRLLNYNSNKLVKTNIITFILIIVINLFNDYSNDSSLSNKDIDNFKQYLSITSEYFTENKFTQNEDNIDFFNDDVNLNNLNEEDQNKIKSEKDDDDERLESVSGNDGNVENDEGETSEFEDFSEIEQNLE